MFRPFHCRVTCDGKGRRMLHGFCPSPWSIRHRNKQGDMGIKLKDLGEGFSRPGSKQMLKLNYGLKTWIKHIHRIWVSLVLPNPYAVGCFLDITLSKEVWKWNFRQYGQIDGKAEVWRVKEEKKRSGKVREEKEREERRCRCAKKVGKSRFTVFFQMFCGSVHKQVGKSRFTVFFQMFCGSGGSKSRLAKAAGAEPAGQMRDEK